MKSYAPSLFLALVLGVAAESRAENVLVEAESFAESGGWVLDTQFIDQMGSPYLMAHGLGIPVDDATTTVNFPKPGTYRLWVRTKNWVAKFSDPNAEADPPGKFQVVVGGKPVDAEFGTVGADWHWQDGGEVTVSETETSVSLKDLTGFNGRCDALLFSSEPGFEPDNTNEVLPAWRREMLGLSGDPVSEGPFDIVFIGGGYAGTCGAISAARMGLKVALVQNRGVLGGNGSSEVRVWAKGNTPPGLYPVGDIIRELEDHAKASPGTYEEFGDEQKESITRAEKNLSLFLHHHAYAVEMENPNRIASVCALDTRTGAVREFTARNFCDSTGHGTIGMLAGADREMIDGGRMGMSNMWRWELTEEAREFPDAPWALDLDETKFPYPRKFHAEWFWESGYDKHPLTDLEAIRDWNLRANFGAWHAMKNKKAYDRYDQSGNAHQNARLTWMAYVGGTRETQQLLGDIVLTEEDIVNKRPFPDGCVLTTWSVDLHYPKEQYAFAFPENPFISVAVHGKGVDRKRGYPVPYRCFYSRNIENLFMAGRNISVTHEALGTVRVMKTCGMMGVVVGKAAALCSEHDVSPREVYYQHLEDLIELLKMPGYMRRDTLKGEFYQDPNLPVLEQLDIGFISKASLSGIVIDDSDAKFTGKWTHGGGLKNYVEDGYHYASGNGEAKAVFEIKVPKTGDYEVRVSFQPHENRSSRTPFTVSSSSGEKTIRVNQKIAPPLAKGFATLGVHRFEAGTPGSVTIGTDDIDGNAHADAVQLLPQD